MQKIIALVLVLLVALAGYKMGLDAGMITVLIVISGAVGFLLLRVYKKHGAKGIVNGVLSAYDPTLPPLSSGRYSQTADYPVNGQYGEPYHIQQVSEEHPRTTIQQVDEPTIQGTLTPAPQPQPPQPGYAPLPPVNPYEMHLGSNAYIDIQQAFINALLLDAIGNVTRVMAEEVASKGVPLLFVDIADTFAPLLAEFPLGWRICSPASLEDGTVDPRAIPLSRETKDQAQHIGHTILQEGWQVLFQFKSYSSPIDAVVTLWNLVNGMRAWEHEQQSRNGRFLPCLVIITEAYRFCPDTNTHSLFKEFPDLAQAVREQMIRSLQTQGDDGIFWYLTTRKVTGMDPDLLRQCQLWMIQKPSVSEVQSGWITAYTGIEPQDLQRVPSTHTLIMDITTRNPQMIAIRPSRAQGANQGNATYILPPLTELPQVTTPPFPKR